MRGVRGLPTLADLQMRRRAVPKHAMPSQLQERQAERASAVKREAEFRTAIWIRDRGRCRCCGRVVLKTMTLDPRQGHVHHIHGRGKGLRHELRTALLLCAFPCHERVTGAVGKPRLRIVGRRTFMLNGTRLIDANYGVMFREDK